MSSVHREAKVQYSPKQMYDIVNDVASYPDFLPWCYGSEVLSQNEDEVRARLDLSYCGLHQSFSTVNRLQNGKMIEVRLLDGPFSHLEGFWRFEPLSDASCYIEFDLAFEFAGSIFDFALNSVFSQVANNLVDAFCERARELYET